MSDTASKHPKPSESPLRIVASPTIAKWRRLHEERVGSFRVFDVSRIELEDGARRGRGDAFTMRCNDWCNVVAITAAGEIVLVWQYRFGTDSFSLEIPGGIIDTGEAPEAAAARELREETGYEAERIEPLIVVEPNPAMQSNRCHTFLATGARRSAAPQFDAMEEIETVLLPAARIGELLDSSEVKHALVQGALEAYWRKHRPTADGAVEDLVTALEDLQRRKVLDLATRLRPGLTHEDVRSPHDFRELDDPDWQHADGVLVGIQSVLAAVRARRRETDGAP